MKTREFVTDKFARTVIHADDGTGDGGAYVGEQYRNRVDGPWIDDPETGGSLTVEMIAFIAETAIAAAREEGRAAGYGEAIEKAAAMLDPTKAGRFTITELRAKVRALVETK